MRWLAARRRMLGWAAGFAMVVACVGPLLWGMQVSAQWRVPALAASGLNLLFAAPGAVLIGLLGPLVSYRRRDGLLILVPLFAIPVAWRIGWRLTRLDRRDWPPRPGEVVRGGAGG